MGDVQMKRVLAALGFVVFAGALSARGDAFATYTVQVPWPPQVNLTANEAENAWLSSNRCVWCDGGTLFKTNEAHLTNKDYSLAMSHVGMSYSFEPFAYCLGDALNPPDNASIDWEATYEAYRAQLVATGESELTGGFLFVRNGADSRVIVTRGGAADLDWVTTDGKTNTVTYETASFSSGRPMRIYWTDYPYNNQKIDLSGKFVKFYGNPSLVEPARITVTNDIGGIQVVENDKIASGLYLNKDSMVLEARGTVEGQVVMAYYKDGNYTEIQHVQVVAVCRPDTIVLEHEIGSPVKPDGRGYGVKNLKPVVQAGIGDVKDGRGDYLYQHAGQHSYSAHDGDVYPIRPTVGQPWKAEVCWMEEDAMKVYWPFELDQYESTWPKDTTPYVRGDLNGDAGKAIIIPSAYTAQLMTYQEPNGHAKDIAADGTFVTDLNGTGLAEGYSLVKLAADDNIWFLPVRSVLRSNTNLFTLAEQKSLVGQPLMLDTVGREAVAERARFVATSNAAPYVYAPGTPKSNYDVNLYAETNSASVVYPVSDADKIEVWWGAVVQGGGMPEPVTVPTLPVVYRPRWPDLEEAPRIVLASQQGSARESRYGHFGAARLDAANARLTLQTRTYFPNGGGTLAFWTQFTDEDFKTSGTNAAATLLQLTGASGSVSLALRHTENWRLDLLVNGTSVATKEVKLLVPAADWRHVALTYGAKTLRVYVNATNVLSATVAEGFLAGALTPTFGSGGANDAPVGRKFAEIVGYASELTGDQIEAERFKVHAGGETGLTGYWSFRPGEDLISTVQTRGDVTRTFVDRSADDATQASARSTAVNTTLSLPGAPLVSSCVIVGDSDSTPTVYRQNDPARPGYNPNEEHAFLLAGGGGYVTWALRCDLGKDDAKQGVFVEYVKNGKNCLQYYNVMATDERSPAFADVCTAGLQLPGPKPLTLMSDPWLAEDYWTTDRTGGAEGVYRDRKGQLWCRRGGANFDIHMYYRNQDGFDWPTMSTPPPVGASVPWLSLLDKPNAIRAKPNAEKPHAWTWTTVWPENVPEMKVGQTLTVSSGGLPEVWNALSVAVVYPVQTEGTNVVMLSDPTVMQYRKLSSKDFESLGLKAEPNGGLTLRQGKYRFTEASPFISERLYYDKTTEKLCFLGEREERKAGATVLYPNVLSAEERRGVDALVSSNLAATVRAPWVSAVAGLATNAVLPNVTAFTQRKDSAGTVRSEVKTTYGAVDHYALTALGGYTQDNAARPLGSTNYVVLIENDATAETMAFKEGSTVERQACAVSDGDSVGMYIIKVVPEYYVGRALTREDANNLLSQQLTILYSDPFGGKPDDYRLEWWQQPPSQTGAALAVGSDETQLLANGWKRRGAAEAGLTRFVIGKQGDTLDNMVNKYWTCRYQALPGTPARAVMGERWSVPCDPPALAEGWLQRCLNNVTPFTQRMTDLYSNKAETPVTMLQEAGRPYTGDVALNQDNLTSVGLIELYETLLNKGESMSLLLGATTDGACQQLLLAVERLGDLYKVLGDEAYSDAKNPTIGFGQTVDGFTKVEFGSEASSLFCFDNQVKTLLDEELCLLRGRTGVSLPTCRLAPYYNRLVWNFTRGITAGEVAYAVNYAVNGVDNDKARLSEEEAAALYPQGHGDAYGHYLSALKGWYRLLRNPNFNWDLAKQGEMNVADAAVNVDYSDEAKFATAAADLAKTAADVVDLTARAAWRDNGDGVTAPGYLDSNPTNSFGYGEWASRGGYGALANWVVANSLLPMDQTLSSGSSSAGGSGETSKYTDQGLARIDRGNTPELEEICEAAASIVRAVDRIDCGLNPLGLSDNAIPFDIAPGGVADGTRTHFEQVRDRATTALGNARKVLERAQTQSNRMRLIQSTGENLAEEYAKEEEAYDEQLLSYYGSPYSDDIGPGKTYEQGYEGADLYHYLWLDFESIGMSKKALSDIEWNALSVTAGNIVTQGSFTAVIDYMKSKDPENKSTDSDVHRTSAASKLGVVCKPDSITGYRNRPGKIQEKLMEFLRQYQTTKFAGSGFDRVWAVWREKKAHLQTQVALDTTFFVANEALLGYKFFTTTTMTSLKMLHNYKTLGDEIEGLINLSLVKSAPSIVGAGMTVISSPRSLLERMTVPDFDGEAAKTAIENTLLSYECFTKQLELSTALAENAYKFEETLWKRYEDVMTAAKEVASAYSTYHTEITKLNVLIDECRTVIAEAEAILGRREAARKRQVNALSKLRYNEMLFRKLRDKTLAQYSATFDLAQKYVFMAAQVYDYETGLKREADGSRDDFKAKIVSTRSLGAFDSEMQPMVADDGDLGLSGYLAQMNANWLVLKPRLGINNPQQYTTWFSLRRELFRIYGTAAGDKNWAAALKRYWVEDVQAHPVYKRHCQKFQSQYGLKEKEPGLVIPFSTTIDFAKNLFGNDLAGGDHAYDSTWYSTRIAAAGVWFDGYNELTAEATKTAQGQLAENPTVYLVPTGYDCLRAPGQEDGWYWKFSVVDQVIPAPYAIGSYELDSEAWYPSMKDADWEGTDPTVKIRRHPMFRAYYGAEGAQPSDSRLDATRLIGRSVWNTEWYLIIPAGSMNADRDKAMEAFVSGYDTNRDGKLDVKPVSDIKIGFRTYSQSGN